MYRRIGAIDNVLGWFLNGPKSQKNYMTDREAS